MECILLTSLHTSLLMVGVLSRVYFHTVKSVHHHFDIETLCGVYIIDQFAHISTYGWCIKQSVFSQGRECTSF